MCKILQLPGIFIAILFTASISLGEEKMVLKPTLMTGKTYVVEHEMDMTTQIAVPGQPAGDQKMQMNSGMEMSISKSGADEKKVTIKYTAMKMRMDMMGQVMEMDASDPAQKDTMGAMLDAAPTMIYDKDDNFLRMEGMDDLKGNPMTAAFANPDSLKQLVNGMMGDVPAEAVAPGYTWKSKLDMPIQGMGNMSIDISNKFEKVEVVDGAKCAMIVFKGNMSGKISPAEGINVEFKEGSTFSGSYHYDPKIAYNRKQLIKTNMTMKMTIPNAGDMEIPIVQDQTVRLVKVKDNE